MHDNGKRREDMRKKGLLFGMAALMAVSMTACSGSENAEPSTAVGQQTNAVSEENNTSSDATETDTFTEAADDEDNDDDNNGEENTIYRQQAEAIFAKTEQMLTALKEGDIDTLIELGDPEDDVVKSLRNVSDSETAKKILKTLYADLCWEVTEDDLRWMETKLQELAQYGERDTDDKYALYMNALAYRWMINFDDNILLYFKAGDVVSENFVAETEEQAFEILQTGLDNTPLNKMSSLTISTPDEEGNFRFFYEGDYLFKYAKLDELEYYSENEMAQRYVSELMDIGSTHVICDTEAKYEENDELFVQAVQYAVDKDFEALTDLLQPELESDYDYRSEYGAYDELNDAQKAFVDSMVEKAVITWVDYSLVQSGNGKKYREGSIKISFPYIGGSDEQAAAFLEQHQVMELSGSYYFGTSASLKSDFLYGYYHCIKYAKNNIE